MKSIELERNNDKICLYTKSHDFSCELPEMDAIEILVSILRANYEIVYIRDKKTDLFDKIATGILEIIKKKRYELVICLENHIITVEIFGKHFLNYDFDSFEQQCEIIYSFLKHNYGNGDIDYKIFSPTYLEHMLGVDIPQIERVEYTTEKILSLMLYERSGVAKPMKVRINEHSLFRKLQQGFIDDGYKSTNHIFENNAERINNVMKEVNESTKIFPVVVYGEEDVVRDGTHRLACLYYLYGNIDIPVIRVYVKKPYYSYTMYRAAINNIEMEVVK